MAHNWPTVKLSDVSAIKRGAGSQYLTYVDSPNQGIRLIRIGDFLSDEPKYVENTKDMSRFILSKNDLLIAGTGATAGITFEVPDRFVGHAFSYNAPRIRVNEGTSSKYIIYYLKSQTILRQQHALFTGNAQPFLDTKAIGGFKIALPPLPEQQKIATVLSTWDRAIETVEALIANAERQKKALMQQLLPRGTQRPPKRLPGFSGEWGVCCLNDLAKVSMGSSPPSKAYNETGDGLPLIQGNADIVERATSPRIYTSQITQTCEPGDLILSVRAPVGEIARSNHKACLGRGVAGIKTKAASDRSFVYYLLLDAERKWLRYAQGSTFQAVNSKDVKGFAFLVPCSAKERSQIGEVLNQAEQSEHKLNSQLNALRQEKAALMQQLLTGKRRVKVTEGEVAYV